METVNEVEWDWSVNCPKCATTYSEYDEQVNLDYSRPIVTCDECGCVFEVSCVEC